MSTRPGGRLVAGISVPVADQAEKRVLSESAGNRRGVFGPRAAARNAPTDQVQWRLVLDESLPIVGEPARTGEFPLPPTVLDDVHAI